jgi:monofunctional biosynthetic peptidoglycan transglycosylase
MARRRRGCLILALLVLLALGASIVVAELLLLSRIRQLAHENPTTTLWMKRRARSTDAPSFRQLFVPLPSMPAHLQWAVILSEDASFYHHTGIDWAEMKTSFLQNLRRREVVRGGSTITMQAARILFLWPGRNFTRKLLELPIALQMEEILTKQRILELYLNYVEWGSGVFGCQAASLHYFSKPCWRLTPDESALLAACLPNPGRRNPARPSRLVRSKQERILRMLERRGVLGQ